MTKNFNHSSCPLRHYLYTLQDWMIITVKLKKKTIVQCLQKLGIADKNYIQELIRECEVLETNSNQILHLTQEIKKVSYPERLKIIEMLVEIIYADKKLDSFEDNLIRMVAGLIYIESADMGAIRINIKKKLNL